MRGNLESIAYDKIKVAISKGYIKKGSKLREIALAKSLNMSRATVKGAVKRLVYEGLAKYEINKGVSVVNPSLEDIKDSFLVRIQLEKMAARLAAKAMNNNDLDELNELVQKEKDIFKARDLYQYYEINTVFHLRIAEKSNKKILVHYVKELLQKTTIYLILFDPFYQILEESNSSPSEHLQIVQWLEKKDAENAANEIQLHLENTMANIDMGSVLPQDYLEA
ncbi:MAG: GntR family transcriptional regulator [Deltaproteobacteria bacterium]|nr:GntR family transcriptional regulator [Deltaproteobacteria bacterium]